MHILNLDPDFTPLGQQNSLTIEQFTFAGGEPHLRILGDLSQVSSVSISHRINSFNDVGFLLLAVDALRRAGIQKLSLILPYLPAARQDRVMVAGEPLSVKIYTDLINSLQFEQVTVLDVHSEVGIALLDRCHAVSNAFFIQEVLKQLGEVILVSPDGGALKKIYKLSAALGGLPVVEGSKIRDVKTGKLSSFKVYAEDLKGANCLVVDDICDGGGTFLGLAEALKAKGAGELYLAISHGIFSKGVAPLAQAYQHIFTTNSIKTLAEHSQLTQYSLNTALLDLH